MMHETEKNIEAVTQRFSVKKYFPENFAKFTGKHLCQSFFLFFFFFRPEACNFIKEKTLVEVFPCDFFGNF